MSKRASERKTAEGPAVAKPRSVCLVSRNLLSAKQTPSVDSGASQGRNSVLVSTGKLAEWQKDDNPFLGTGKRVRRGVCERSVGTVKLVRGIENQLVRTRLDYHSIQISDNQYIEKVLKNLRKNVNLSKCAQVLNQKTNVLIW